MTGFLKFMTYLGNFQGCPKYNYSKAYYRAFMCLKEGFNTNYSTIELKNDLNFSFAKYYLLKAKEIEKKDEDLIFSINVELKSFLKNTLCFLILKIICFLN